MSYNYVAVGISFQGLSMSRAILSDMTDEDLYRYMEREAQVELDEIIIVHPDLSVRHLSYEVLPHMDNLRS